MITVCPLDQCTGCKACCEICPKKSISISDSIKSNISMRPTIRIPQRITVCTPKQNQIKEVVANSPLSIFSRTDISAISDSQSDQKKTQFLPQHPPKLLPRPPPGKQPTLVRPKTVRLDRYSSASLGSMVNNSIVTNSQSLDKTGGLTKQPILPNSIKLSKSFELEIIHCFSSSSTKTFSYTINSSIESKRAELIIHYVNVAFNDTCYE